MKATINTFKIVSTTVIGLNNSQNYLINVIVGFDINTYEIVNMQFYKAVRKDETWLDIFLDPVTFKFPCIKLHISQLS